MFDELNLFIDANAYLSFYAFTNDDLEELHKLIKLIERNKLHLLITTPVIDEWMRNREGKINHTIQEFRKHQIPAGVPRLMQGYEEFKEYTAAAKNLMQLRDKMVNRARQEAFASELAADKLILELIKAATVLKSDEDIQSAALDRRLRGNPPGKDGHRIGDQLNWESLKKCIPQGENIHIVSIDTDYSSPLDKEQPNDFLKGEWRSEKKGELFLYIQLGTFLKKHFPEIRIAADIDRRDVINALKWSGSFSATHSAIGKLEKHLDLLEPAEVKELIEAAVKNGQIWRIGTDPDVRALYARLLEKDYIDIAPWETHFRQYFEWPEPLPKPHDDLDDEITF